MKAHTQQSKLPHMPPSPKNDLTQGPVARTLFLLSAPMMVGVSSSILVQAFEVYFIGQLGTKEIAAVTFTFPLTMALSSIALGISIGTSSVIARTVGARDTESAKRLATHSLILVGILMSVLSFVGWLLINPLFTRMGAEPETLELISLYLDIVFATFPFMTVMMVAASVMRANGEANIPGMAMTSAAALNLILDPILIFGWFGFPRLELAGAAWAVAISRFVTCLVMLYFVRRHDMLNLTEILNGFANSCKKVLHVGLPAMATQMIGPVSGGIITALLARHGESVLAGFGIATRIEAVAVMLLFALSGSIGPFVGQNWGANERDRVRAGVRSAYTFCLVWGAFVLVLLLLFGGQLAAFVDDNAQAVKAAAIYLSVVPISYGAWGVLMMASASFNALGKPLPSTVLSFLRMFIIYVPLALLFNHFYGYAGVFVATAIANCIMGLLGFLWFKRTFFSSTADATVSA